LPGPFDIPLASSSKFTVLSSPGPLPTSDPVSHSSSTHSQAKTESQDASSTQISDLLPSSSQTHTSQSTDSSIFRSAPTTSSVSSSETQTSGLSLPSITTSSQVQTSSSISTSTTPNSSLPNSSLSASKTRVTVIIATSIGSTLLIIIVLLLVYRVRHRGRCWFRGQNLRRNRSESVTPFLSSSRRDLHQGGQEEMGEHYSADLLISSPLSPSTTNPTTTRLNETFSIHLPQPRRSLKSQLSINDMESGATPVAQPAVHSRDPSAQSLTSMKRQLQLWEQEIAVPAPPAAPENPLRDPTNPQEESNTQYTQATAEIERLLAQLEQVRDQQNLDRVLGPVDGPPPSYSTRPSSPP